MDYLLSAINQSMRRQGGIPSAYPLALNGLGAAAVTTANGIPLPDKIAGGWSLTSQAGKPVYVNKKGTVKTPEDLGVVPALVADATAGGTWAVDGISVLSIAGLLIGAYLVFKFYRDEKSKRG